MLRKSLIANRGEIAVRIIRACREMGIETVAVYSEADQNALHVQLANEAYLLGTATPSESYLNISKLIQIAQDSGCDCVHPGYGFLSENETFAQAVLDAGITWVGPMPHAIRRMGVKTEARALMEKANVPLVPGFASETGDDRAFIDAAEQIGYPVMVKAAGGGGGKGIRIVYQPSELTEALAGARREAQKAFGDPRVFLERYIESGRHIEVQVIADQQGNTLHLFERECSTQRRHQKIIEETPSLLLTDEQRQAIGEAAVNAAKAVQYVNAGTVEFIATEKGEFYFLEMNTRLQVEHPVTELVTGYDLVKLQFLVASSEHLPFSQSDVSQRGHAIECRVYAEDPRNHFLPATGIVHTFIPPQGPNIRVDTYLQSGEEITIHYDPMIAKVIVYDSNRANAIQRMIQALQDTVVLGVTTNIEFLLSLLSHPAFVQGNVDTGFVDAHLAELIGVPPPLTDTALIALALSEAQNAPAKTLVGGQAGDLYSPWKRGDGFRLSKR
jgi:3-methylcrotonyl-CoA carboxylase alpha subunit